MVGSVGLGCVVLTSSSKVCSPRGLLNLVGSLERGCVIGFSTPPTPRGHDPVRGLGAVCGRPCWHPKSPSPLWGVGLGGEAASYFRIGMTIANRAGSL